MKSPVNLTIAAFIVAYVVIVLLLFACYPRAADAHDAPTGWAYPLECCSGIDCREVAAPRVREGEYGYTVPTGELLRYNDRRLRPSPDGEFHWCSVAGTDDGRTLCLFVPPRAY